MSDNIIIEIIHSLKEIIVKFIDKKCSPTK